MRRGFQILGFGLVVTCVACNAGPSVVGTWTSERQILGRASQITAHFGPDGKFTVDTVVTQGGRGLVAHDLGHYTLKGDKLSMIVDDVSWDVRGVTPATEQRLRSRLDSQKAQILADSNQKPDSTLQWQGNDTLLVTDSEGRMTWKRAK